MPNLRAIPPKTWAKAAGLAVVLVLFGTPLILVSSGGVVQRLFGKAAAENFDVNVFGFYMWAWELAFVLVPLAIAIFVLVVVARWIAETRRSRT